MDIIIECFTPEDYKRDFLNTLNMLRHENIMPRTLMYQAIQSYCGLEIYTGYTTDINEIIEAIEEETRTDINEIEWPIRVKKIRVHFAFNDRTRAN